jgi:molybdopterin molybdotransferase
MNETFPQRIDFSAARAIIAAVTAQRRLPAEPVPLARARERVLAEALVADVPLPGFDNSAMDGFAMCGADAGLAMSGGLTLAGEQFAGVDLRRPLAPGECIRITTGAPMPPGADAVLVKEQADETDGRVVARIAVATGTHVRHAGEDVRPGDLVLESGQRLQPAQLGLAASLGRPTLQASQRPTVAVFTTGDELRPPGQILEPGQIHDSNRVLLQTLLQAEGCEPVAWPVLPDDPRTMLSALRDNSFAFDLLVTCGGVSAGEKDLLPTLLREHGEIFFWKVMMKPGMPVLFGRLDDALVLGLPGNPVSVLATFLTLGRDLLDGLEGATAPRRRWRARLLAPFAKKHARLEFLRGRLRCDDDGRLEVLPDPADGSHRLRGAADADALLVLPEGPRDFAAGEVVEVIPLGRRD